VRRRLVMAGLALGVLAAGGVAYVLLVREGVLRYNRYDRRERGLLREGDQAPDLEVAMYDGSRLRLSELWRARPALLVFGSCT